MIYLDIVMYINNSKSKVFNKFFFYKNLKKRKLIIKLKSYDLIVEENICLIKRYQKLFLQKFVKIKASKESLLKFYILIKCISERKNIILMGAILAMLSYAKLCKIILEGVIQIGNYSHNKSPT